MYPSPIRPSDVLDGAALPAAVPTASSVMSFRIMSDANRPISRPILISPEFGLPKVRYDHRLRPNAGQPVLSRSPNQIVRGVARSTKSAPVIPASTRSSNRFSARASTANVRVSGRLV